MIEHLHIRAQIHQSLQTGYVALLGQRGIGVKTTVSALLSRQQTLYGMQYIPVSLPLDVSDEQDFKEILMERLAISAASMPPTPLVAQLVQEVVKKNARRSIDIRLRKVLDTMATEADSTFLVLVHVSAEPRSCRDLCLETAAGGSSPHSRPISR